MTALEIDVRAQARTVHAQPAPMLRDIASIAGRALRAVPRELESVIPPIFIAVFFFVINIGTLQHVTQSNISGFDIKAFMLPCSPASCCSSRSCS
jgi:ABC-2 type transport system permease protein